MHIFTKQTSSPLKYATVSYTDQGSSPPMPSSHSSTTEREHHHGRSQKQSTILKWARLAFAIFTLLISIASVAVLAHMLQSYNATVMPGQYNLALWPNNTDVKPTLALLIPSAIVVFLSLVYIAFSTRSKQNLIFTAIYLASGIASLIGIAYSFAFERRNITISAWSCEFYDGARSFARDSTRLQLSVSTASLVPIGFDTICIESRVGRWLVVSLFVVQVFALGMALVGFARERKVARSVGRDGLSEKSSFS